MVGTPNNMPSEFIIQLFHNVWTQNCIHVSQENRIILDKYKNLIRYCNEAFEFQTPLIGPPLPHQPGLFTHSYIQMLVVKF